MNSDLNQAKNLYNKGQIDEAIKLLSDETSTLSLNAESESEKFLLLGKCYHKKSHDEQALSSFEQSIQKNQHNYQAYYARGTLLLQKNKFAQAYRDYSKVTENMNTSVQLHRSISYCLLKMGRYYEALTEISTAIYFDKQKSEQKNDLLCQIFNVIIKNSLEQYQDSLIDIDEFIANNPEHKDNKDIIEQQICALCESGDYDKCTPLIDKNIASNSNLYIYKAKCCKDKKQAIPLLKKAIETDTTIKEKLYFLLAKYTYEEIKDEEGAINYYKKAIENDKRYFDAYIEIAKIYMSKKDYSKALEILNEGEPEIDEIDEKKFQLLYLLTKAEVLFNLSKVDEAKSYYNFVTESLHGEYIETYFLPRVLKETLDKYFELFYIKSGFFKNNFQVQETEKIGSGGFCQVFIGTLKGIKYAVKKYKFTEEMEQSVEKKNMFLLSIFREIYIMETLQNVQNQKCPPNCECKNLVLRFVTVFYINSQLYLITPLCSGGDLSLLLFNKSIEISKKNRVYILLQVAKAIRHLHSYVPPYIHHDIKSLNVLLVDKYDPKKLPVIKLIDFGLTKRQSNNTLLECTPAYASPELINFHEHNESLDIYSFGIFMWEVFARDFPFKNVPKDEIFRRVLQGDRPEIEKMEAITPNEIRNLYKRCVAKEMDERPKIDEVVEVLNTIYLKC